ncbi:MAG TPA: metal-dependent hydrolase [Pseudonocardia sp.]
MLAHTHALSGAAAFLAAAPAIDITDPAQLAGGAAMAAGAALLPDLDHHSGTASHTWGPITIAIGRLTAWLTGGHRNGTHTLLAAILATFVTYSALQAPRWVAIPVVALLAGLALVACEALIPGEWERLWPANLAASAAFAAWVVTSGLNLAWLPHAVGIGWVAHIVGDTFTTGGTTPLKPISSKRYRFTRLNTGGPWEIGMAWLLTAAIGVLTWATFTAHPGPWTNAWPG